MATTLTRYHDFVKPTPGTREPILVADLNATADRVDQILGPSFSILNETGGDPTGVADAGPAFNAAAAKALAAGGGWVYVPQGTYKFTTAGVLPGNGVGVRGDGVGKTILTDGATLGTAIIHGVGRSSVTIRDLTIRPQLAFGSYAFYLDGSGSVTRDVLIENVRVEQLNPAGSGAVITGAGGGLERVTVRNLVVTGPAAGTGAFGLSIGAGTFPAESTDLLIDGCTFDGFVDGCRNNTTGIWNNVKVVGSRFTNAAHHGAYFYHCGQIQVVGCEFSGNDVGCYSDEGAGSQGPAFVACRFTGNTTMGLYGEEWARGALTGCVFQGNGYGYWMMSGTDVSVTGCSFTHNERDGVLVDKGFDMLSLSGSGFTYQVTNSVFIQDVVFAGCLIAANKRNGISVKGVQRGFALSGCTIAQNGIADNPTPTNYADVNLDADADGANNYAVRITGCTIGNLGGTGTDTGYTNWGVRSASGTLAHLDVAACRIEGVTIAMGVPTGAVSVTGTTFASCGAAIALPAGVVWRANPIVGGTLAVQPETNPGDFTVGGDFIQSGGNGARIDVLTGAFQGLRLGNAAGVSTTNYNVAGDANGALLLNALTGQTISLRVANATDILTIAAAVITAAQLLTTVASATGSAGFRLPHGAAPTSPVNGDVWTTTAGLFCRINGVTKTVTLT